MTKNLTSGNPMKLLISFTLPMLFGMLFQQMYNMVDTMIVGKLLGSRALAAVGATGSVNFLVIGFCNGICSGFAIPVAQKTGAGEYSQMRQVVANAAYLSAAFALVMTVATGLLCDTIMTAMGTPEDIYQNAYNYIFIIFMGIPATFLYNLLAGVIRSLGDSRTPVYFLALSSGLNILLDLVLILCCHMGVAGAAAATVISQAVSGLACLAYAVRHCPELKISRPEARFSAKTCLDLCAMGLPMGLQYSVTAIGSIILQAAVNGLGSLYVAAVTAGAKLCELLSCPLNAMGAAMATYCGQNVGAGKLDRLGKGIWDCSVMGLVYALLSFGAMLLFAPACAMWFIDAQEEGELGLMVSLVSRYVRTATGFGFTLALVNIVRFSIQGMGYSVFAILAGVLEMLARTVMGRVFVPRFGYSAVCLASPAAWVCADLFLIPACVLCIRRLRRSCAAAKTEKRPRHAAYRSRPQLQRYLRPDGRPRRLASSGPDLFQRQLQRNTGIRLSRPHDRRPVRPVRRPQRLMARIGRRKHH